MLAVHPTGLEQTILDSLQSNLHSLRSMHQDFACNHGDNVLPLICPPIPRGLAGDKIRPDQWILMHLSIWKRDHALLEVSSQNELTADNCDDATAPV